MRLRTASVVDVSQQNHVIAGRRLYDVPFPVVMWCGGADRGAVRSSWKHSVKGAISNVTRNNHDAITQKMADV